MITFKQKVLFTEQECDLILKTYMDKPIDEIENTNDKRYQSKNIDYNSDKWILDRFINWVENELNIKLEWSKAEIKEFYLQSYTTGDVFKKHNDNKHNRVYGCGLLLKNDFKGGDFVVYTPKDEIIQFNNIIVLIFFRNSQIIFKRNQLI